MKKISTLFIIIGILVIASYIYLRYVLGSGGGFQKAEAREDSKNVKSSDILDLRPKLIAKLQQLVKEGSNGLYNLSIQSIEPDILQSKIGLKNIYLIPDSAVLNEMDHSNAAPNDVFKIKLDSLQITGININDFISKDHIDIRSVNLKNPLIEVFHDPKSYNKANDKNSPGILERIQKTLKHLYISKMEVRDARLIDYNLPKKTSTIVKGMLINLTDILIDSTMKGDKRGICYSKTGEIIVKNYMITTSDKFYNFKIGKVTFTSPENKMHASDIEFIPRYNRVEFQSKLSYAQEQYTFIIPSITMQGINWWNMINSESILSKSAQIDNGKVDIYLDLTKHYLPVKRNGFPDQLLMELPFAVDIPNVKINNLNVSYSEYHPSSGKTGKLYFDHINATITNVTNIPSNFKNKSKAEVKAKAEFMHFIPMNGRIEFDLSNVKTGLFNAQINMGSFDGTKVNSISESMGMFLIKRGDVHSAKAQITGDNGSGRGKVDLLYNDLHITPIKKDDNIESGIKKKSIFSFIANKFVIKDDNPSSGNNYPRTAEAYYKRGSYNSFFNLIWKTSLVGILKITGIPEKFAH